MAHSENYHKIYQWIRDLRLAGKTETIYAIIYSFTEHGRGYYGGYTYLADIAVCHITTAKRAVADLVKRGLIVKTKVKYKGKMYNVLHAIRPMDRPVDKSDLSDASCTDNSDNPATHTVSDSYFIGSTLLPVYKRKEKSKKEQNNACAQAHSAVSSCPSQDSDDQIDDQIIADKLTSSGIIRVKRDPEKIKKIKDICYKLGANDWMAILTRAIMTAKDTRPNEAIGIEYILAMLANWIADRQIEHREKMAKQAKADFAPAITKEDLSTKVAAMSPSMRLGWAESVIERWEDGLISNPDLINLASDVIATHQPISHAPAKTTIINNAINEMMAASKSIPTQKGVNYANR